MKRFIFILPFMAFCLAMPASGRCEEKPGRWDWSGHHEMKLGISLPSLIAQISVGTPIVTDQKYSVRSTPTLSLSYEYNFKRWIAIEAGAALTMAYYVNPRYGGVKNYNLGFYANAKFYWLNRKNIRLYSSAGLSLWTTARTWPKEDGDPSSYGFDLIFPNIKLIGLTAGHKIYGFAEIGTGASGIINAGIGYRF